MEITRVVNASLEIWGSVVSLIIMICFVLSRKIQNRGERLYLELLGCNMGAMSMDVLAMFFRGKTGSVADFCVRAVNYLQFVLVNILIYLFLKYMLTYMEERIHLVLSKAYDRIGIILLVFSVGSLTINLGYPYLYRIDAQNLYSRLSLYPLIYLSEFVMLIIAVLLMARYGKRLKWNERISFGSYVMIPGISLIASILFYGITFGYLGTTVALTVLFLFLQFEQRQQLIQQNVISEVNYLKKHERIVNEGIKISSEAENVEDSIKIMLRYLGQMIGGERVYIFEKNENNEDDNSYEWCAVGIPPQINILQNIPPEVCAPWYDAFQKNDIVVIHDLKDIQKKFPLIYDTLLPQNVHTLVAAPLHDKNRIIGFFGIDNPPEYSIHMTKDILEITSNYMVSLLKRRDIVSELKRLSYTDSGTGARNRMAMYQHFEELKNQSNIGIVFCDITGLKKVNDTQGHAAGDEMIRNTYECLKEGFDSSEIFRIGGDEFVILCSGNTETELQKKISRVQTALQVRNIAMAIGAEWRPHVEDTVENTIMNAEKKMYKEKKEWYIKTGNERRQNS
ncbi:MAG: diguanylate cyclase [Eubacteriales bacterium]|nr:diguanylate cyclase [Eubacteriales bacterium]